MKIMGSCWGFDAMSEYLEGIGHQTEAFAFKHHLEDHGSINGSNMIVKDMVKAGADIILIERGSSANRTNISPKAIRKMKRLGMRPVLIHWDIPLVKNLEDLKPDHMLRFYGKSVLYYDTVFITFPKGVELLREMGVNAHLIYKAADHSFQPHIYGYNIKEKTYDVSLCGTSYGKCRFSRGFERSEIALNMIELSRQMNYKFGIFGKGWVANDNDPFNDDKYYSNMRGLVAKSHEFEPYYEGKEKQAKICRIFAGSKINIGTLLTGYKEYWGARPFEVLGAKSFLLLGNVHPQSELLKDGEHFVKFDNHDDLIDKVKYYMEHDEERDKIAKAGFKHVISNHSVRNRIKEIVRVLNI